MATSGLDREPGQGLIPEPGEAALSLNRFRQSSVVLEAGSMVADIVSS